MLRTRILTLVLVVVAATSAVASATAAAEPEFLSSAKKALTKKGLTAKNGEVELLLPKEEAKIICKEGREEGKVKGTKEVEKLTLTWEKCVAEFPLGSAKRCAANSISPKGKAEEIITDPLKGKLVEIPKVQTEVGLLTEAEATTFLKLEASCLPAKIVEVTGGVVGWFEPIKKLIKTTENAFLYDGIEHKLERQEIEEFVSGKIKERKVLEGGKGAVALLINYTFSFEEEVEVT